VREHCAVRITTDDGVGLAVDVAGSGPGLVLVHGFTGAKEDFADHVPDLARDHTVVTFDHRGHGASDKPDRLEAYSLERLAADVLAVADATGLDRFRLLGHSMGGMVVRRVVLARPDRVEALVLMDTSPGPVPGMDVSLVDAAAQIALEQGMDVLKPLLDEAAVLETPAHRRVVAERPGYQEFCDRKWADCAPAMWAALAREIVRQPDQLAALAAVACPTLVIVGEQDEPFVDVSRAMAATIPGARLAVVPDAGHSPQFENAREWIARMREFLGALVATA
jgi:pimeloyl-ACP methyl ester carboxylesterase